MADACEFVMVAAIPDALAPIGVDHDCAVARTREDECE
jgi:hypothetical protein